MKTLGDQFFPRSALTNHEHGTVERRGAARALHGVKERKALPDELIRPLHLPTVGGNSHHLARIFARFSAKNKLFSRNSALSFDMARLLYGFGQV